VPRKGRALPLLQLAYDQDDLSPNKSHKQDALLAVLKALPMGERPVVLADRGFHRAGFIGWLAPPPQLRGAYQEGQSCITEASGHRWKLGEEGLKIGEVRFIEGVSYALYHGRPRELSINVALCWRIPKSRAKNPRRHKHSEEPWHLATSLKDAKMAASWYWQRGSIEQSFKDSKSLFGLGRGCVWVAPSA
jgi:Transposase DDE domain